jgi:FkbM family methyltransferase
MSLLSTLKFITSHPLNRGNIIKAIFRFLRWQINTRLNTYPIIYQFTERSKLIIHKGMTGATGNLYCGLHEFEDMLFLLHFLRKNDLFLDVGANIGSYTILASSHVFANTISIEPVPSTFNHLVKNVLINFSQERVEVMNIALGSKKCFVDFTSNFDTVNHVATKSDTESIKVSVEKLDDILLDKKVPILIKIDVEGFETEVLNGAANSILSNELKAIIVELNGSGLRYGYDENLIHEKLLVSGFKPYRYFPINRSLTLIETFGKYNTIYIRDIEFVTERLYNAEKVKIMNKII